MGFFSTPLSCPWEDFVAEKMAAFLKAFKKF
jgi:hypothetical protein